MTMMAQRERPMLSRERIFQMTDGPTLLHPTRTGHRSHRLEYPRQRIGDWMACRNSSETMSIHLGYRYSRTLKNRYYGVTDVK